MQNAECRLQDVLTTGFSLGWIAGKIYHARSTMYYSVARDTSDMETFWKQCNGLTPESEEDFAKGWLAGAGFPLPKQDWGGFHAD